jgi:hypothetical protein
MVEPQHQQLDRQEEKTMNPNPWIVEFAVREQQARDERAQTLADRNRLIARQINPPSRATLLVQAIGQFLVSLGESLHRRASTTPVVTRRLDVVQGS